MTPFLVPPKNVDFLLRRQPDGRTIRQLKSVALDIPRMVLRLVKDVCHNHEVLTHRVQRYVAQDGHWTVASRGNLGNSTKAIKAEVLSFSRTRRQSDPPLEGWPGQQPGTALSPQSHAARVVEERVHRP